jgi:NADH-quinone oxidoreductase subunit L
MVTAGVYLVARCAPLFAKSPQAQEVVAVIGGATALMAALIALTQTDLKRILAYSTISQLGYMFLGMGAGTLLGVTAGMFHLVTHAFFKGLLFLAAGSVMHAMAGVIDIRRFGGLRHVLPVTHATFLVGALGLAGVVPLAGFWSKDAVLAAVWQRGSAGYLALYVLALLTALLTAFYTFRALFLTFYGPKRLPGETHGHTHESPRVMTVPMIVLAGATVVAGFALEWGGWLEHFLAKTPSIACLESASHVPEVAPGTRWSIAALGTLAAAAGIGLAWYLYLAAPGVLRRLTSQMQRLGLYGASLGKFFVDELYAWLIVRPLEALARLSAWLDSAAIDGLVDLVGWFPKGVGATLRWLQGGLIPLYATVMVLGLLVLLGALLM